MRNHIIPRLFRCEVLPGVAWKQPREMLMRFPLLIALTASMVTLAASTAANAAALSPPAFSIIHAGQLLVVPGKPPLSKATVVIEKGAIRQVTTGYPQAADLGLAADTPVID